MKKKQKNFSFIKYFKKYIPLIVLNMVIIVGIYALVFYSSLLSAKGLKAVADNQFDVMLRYLLYTCGIQALIALLNYPVSIIYSYVSGKVYVDMKSDLTARLFEISAESYGESGASSFVQRVLSDPSRTFSIFANVFDLVLEILTDVVIIVYIMTMNIYIGLVIVGVATVIFVYDFFRNRWRKKKNKEFRAYHDEIYSYTNEIVRSQLDIKALSLEDSLKSGTVKKHADLYKKEFKYSVISNSLGSIRTIYVQAVIFLLTFFAVYLYDNFALPLVAALYIYQNRNIFARLSNSINRVQNQMVEFNISKERIYQLYDEDEFPTEKFGNEEILSCNGEIEFKNVNFSYKIRQKAANPKKEKDIIIEKPVLHDINFKINAGESVAFVGRSGAGKSTIASLIPKLYDCEDGQVLLDGIDVKNVSKSSLRKNISLVNQNPYLFNLSIKENLRLVKEDATDDEIATVLQKAYLYDFVMGLEKGLDTIIGENGVKLSGGQKQRLAIARAFLKDSKVIIFDESTSSLDNFAQEEVKKSIESLNENRTVILIAHRLSTIKNADRIYFIENGKIIANGTFEQLFDTCPEFAQLFMVENI